MTSEHPSHRILVVDDNRDSAESMAVLLRLQGHETETAFAGTEVLDAVRRFRPALVLLDIGLPRLDGYEVARRLRADTQCAGLRIAAMSGYGRDEDRTRARRGLRSSLHQAGRHQRHRSGDCDALAAHVADARRQPRRPPRARAQRLLDASSVNAAARDPPPTCATKPHRSP